MRALPSPEIPTRSGDADEEEAAEQSGELELIFVAEYGLKAALLLDVRFDEPLRSPSGPGGGSESAPWRATRRPLPTAINRGSAKDDNLNALSVRRCPFNPANNAAPVIARH